MSYSFGPGVLWATPLTDAYGNAVSNATPVMLAMMQDFSVDFSRDLKELYGQNQFPIDIAAGKGKISVKAKNAQISARALDAVFFGLGMTAGEQRIQYEQTGALIPATPFTITPTVPDGGTYKYDLGVRDAAGFPMQRVASAPVAGQYAVNTTTRVYTFAAADTGKRVYISYGYSVSATGYTQEVPNLLMGQVPKFRADYFSTYDGKPSVLSLYRCVSGKLSWGAKLDDYVVPELEFAPMDDGFGKLLAHSYRDA